MKGTAERGRTRRRVEEGKQHTYGGALKCLSRRVEREIKISATVY